MKPNEKINQYMKENNCSRATAFRRIRQEESHTVSKLTPTPSQIETVPSQNPTPSHDNETVFVPNWTKDHKTKEEAFAHILKMLKENKTLHEDTKNGKDAVRIMFRNHLMVCG